MRSEVQTVAPVVLAFGAIAAGAYTTLIDPGAVETGGPSLRWTRLTIANSTNQRLYLSRDGAANFDIIEVDTQRTWDFGSRRRQLSGAIRVLPVSGVAPLSGDVVASGEVDR